MKRSGGGEERRATERNRRQTAQTESKWRAEEHTGDRAGGEEAKGGKGQRQRGQIERHGGREHRRRQTVRGGGRRRQRAPETERPKTESRRQSADRAPETKRRTQAQANARPRQRGERTQANAHDRDRGANAHRQTHDRDTRGRYQILPFTHYGSTRFVDNPYGHSGKETGGRPRRQCRQRGGKIQRRNPNVPNGQDTAGETHEGDAGS